MIYPELVPERVCQTPCRVTIYGEGLGRDGEPLPVFDKELKCNYQDSAKSVLTAEQKLVQLSGVAMFPGDIAPEVPVLSGGTFTVFGVERQIFKGMKARNPDGTVNYTRLDVV